MGKLNAKNRRHLKRSSFAIPSQRRYPIPDLSHARNALARVSQHGTPAEKAMVRRAVVNKFPSLKKGNS